MNLQETISFVNEKYINILTVDIGLKGGWCCNKYVNRVHSDKLLIGENEGDPIEMCNRMFALRPDIIVAEDVHTMPGQGIVSQGTLMRQKGELIGMAAALDIQVHFIQPMKWIECFTLKRTKHFSTKDRWKKHLLEIANSISPFPDDRLSQYTADAFLMWYYAASQHTPQPLQTKGTLNFGTM